MTTKKTIEKKSVTVAGDVADWLTISEVTKKPKPAVTTADIADLVEHSINEAKPQVKTRRGAGSSIELKVGRRKFVVSVGKPVRKRAANIK